MSIEIANILLVLPPFTIAGTIVLDPANGGPIARGSNRRRRVSYQSGKKMDTVYKKVAEDKTIGFDFSPEGALVGGDTLTGNPNVSVDSADATLVVPTFGTAIIVTSKFYDTDGRSIPVDKGVAVRVTGGDVGIYTLRCLSGTLDGDHLGVNCRLIVKE